MVEIIPAILDTTTEGFEKKLRAIEPYTDRIHLDISDSSFTPVVTIKGYEELKKFPTDKKWDIHFMVGNPERFMHEWYKTSADRFIFHIEVNHLLRGLSEEAHLNDKKVGVSVNPDTPMEAIDEILQYVDYVQFMTVVPGAQGNPFRYDVLGKISMFHEQHPEVNIIADGGINPNTGPQAAIAGASTLIVGSYIFGSDDIAKAMKDLEVLKNFGS